MNHDINDLLYFVTVVEQQSFSMAAEKLGVSKSIVSKYVSRLEKSLGVQLLKRTTRKLTLTEAGHLVYQRAIQVNEDVEQIKQLASAHHEIPQGKIRINAPFSFGHQQMVPAIAAFTKKYPDIRVELILGSYLADLINDGLDLAIYLKEPSNQQTVIRKIATHRMHICASPEYLKKQGQPKKPSDLLKHNCLVYKSLDQARPWIFTNKLGGVLDVPVSGNFSANSSQALLNAALNHMGIVKLSSYIVSDYLQKGKLVNLLDAYCQKGINIYIARANTSYLPKKTRVLIDFLVSYFSKK